MTKTEKHITISFRRAVLPILKYYPILMNAMMLYIMVEYMIGEYVFSLLADSVFGYSILISILLIGLSYERKFCAWHRLLILNMFFNSVLATFDFFGIDVHLSFFLLSVLTAFTLLFSFIMLYNHGWFTKNKM